MTSREGLTPEFAGLRARVRRFIDESIIPQEPVLDKGDEKARVLMKELQARS